MASHDAIVIAAAAVKWNNVRTVARSPALVAPVLRSFDFSLNEPEIGNERQIHRFRWMSASVSSVDKIVSINY